ncbi:hypothetical protein [Variovorax sp. GB1P17]|uniref:hypothetical protein n=1 Tax=Variovorax sp. GB1P17 TaxID=3443740 RepID=UPI003F4568B0
MTLLHPAFSIIKAHKKACIVLNVAFYGLVLIGMVAAAFIPELQARTNLGVAQSLSQPGFMAMAKEAAGNGHLLTTRLYAPVTLPLLIGATYEAIEVIYLMPRF